jgi:hypothetical protein
MKNCTLIFLLVLGFSLSAGAQSVQERSVQNIRKSIRFYPNPATSFVFFEFPKAPPAGTSFQVYNFLGKKVLDLQRLNSRTQVDLTNYTRGFYIYQLVDISGRVLESGKFQVEK